MDGHALLWQSTIAVAPSPALSGLSATVATGDGATAPTPPFNVLVWPNNTKATKANAEVWRVDAIAGDVLTIQRAREGSSAQSVDTTYAIANTATPKVFADLELDFYLKDTLKSIANDDVLGIADMSWLDAGLTGVSDVPFTDYEPETDLTPFPGATTLFYEDPFILDSPYLCDTGGNPATLLWTDAARCPQTVSTLLIIGV